MLQRPEGFDDTEPLEDIIPIPTLYGGKCEVPIIIGSQESKENIEKDMFSFNITTTAKEAEKIVQMTEDVNNVFV